MEIYMHYYNIMTGLCDYFHQKYNVNMLFMYKLLTLLHNSVNFTKFINNPLSENRKLLFKFRKILFNEIETKSHSAL